MTVIQITARAADGTTVEIDLDTITALPGIAQVFIVSARHDGTPVITPAGDYGPSELTSHPDDLRVIGGRVVDTYREINK